LFFGQYPERVMSITVNGVEISPAKIEAEIPRHHDARNPFEIGRAHV
jgi:hypothetical protein